MLIANLFSQLAGGNVEKVAMMINFMSALFSAGTILFLFLSIKRPRKCVFKYEDSEGKLQEAHLDGMMSRICQHEYDHILGRNFVEHVSKFKLKRAEEKAKKLINQMRKSQA